MRPDYRPVPTRPIYRQPTTIGGRFPSPYSSGFRILNTFNRGSQLPIPVVESAEFIVESAILPQIHAPIVSESARVYGPYGRVRPGKTMEVWRVLRDKVCSDKGREGWSRGEGKNKGQQRAARGRPG